MICHEHPGAGQLSQKQTILRFLLRGDGTLRNNPAAGFQGESLRAQEISISLARGL